MSSPISKLPDKVKIGPQYFTITQRNRNEDATLNDGSYGYTIDDGNIIVLDQGISKNKKQVTLLHEIMHSIRLINDAFPKPGKDDDFEAWEHFFIAMWESNLLMVLKDNPSLSDWLLDKNE